MKHASTLLAMLLIITSANTAAAMLVEEAGDAIPNLPCRNHPTSV